LSFAVYFYVCRCERNNNSPESCVIAGLLRGVDENCALFGYYAGNSDNSLPTFRDNVSVPGWVQNPDS